MKILQRSVFVSGARYPVQETVLGLKVHLFGRGGWNFVYQPGVSDGAYIKLTSLIRQVLSHRTIYDNYVVRGGKD